jgi:hypothetical protein
MANGYRCIFGAARRGAEGGGAHLPGIKGLVLRAKLVKTWRRCARAHPCHLLSPCDREEVHMRILLCVAMVVLASPAFAQANNGGTTGGGTTTAQSKITTSRLERQNFKRWCMMYPVSCKEKLIAQNQNKTPQGQ